MEQAHRANTQETETASGISRRTVLKSAAVGAASLTTAGAFGSLLKAAPAQPKIAIVGGGIAGLNAALTLQTAGYRSTIYEASNRIGGRIWTIKDALGPGLTTELGGEFIDSGHDEMLRLARLFRLRLLDFQAPSETGLKETYFFGGRARTEAEIIAAFQPVAAKIADDQDNTDFTDYTDFNALALGLDRTPLDLYLHRVGARGWLYDLLHVAYLTEYGCEINQQSALNLVFLIGTDLSEGFSEFGESDQRYKIDGGNERLILAMGSHLQTQVQTDQALTGIRPHGNGFKLHLAKGNGHHQEVDADIVLLTLPLTLLREVDIDIDLPSRVRKGINQVQYGTNAKVILGYDSRYWRNAGANGLFFTDLPLQSGWDSSQEQPGRNGSLTIYYGGRNGIESGEGSVSEQAEFARRNVQHMFPARTNQSNDRHFRFHWPSYKWAKGSYTCFSPGQYTQFSGVFNQPMGNLFFAGEHCSFDSQGYMNGGAQTGFDAATAIVQQIQAPHRRP
jgi:monoamine oxidase